MKRIIFSLILGAMAIFVGCEQSENPLQAEGIESSEQIQQQVAEPDMAEVQAAIEKDRARIEARTAEVKALLASMPQPAAKAKAGQVTVPDQFSTIQAAVNAAPYGSQIIVKSGTYDEMVILRGGLKLIGKGKPTVKGFAIVAFEDVSITSFNIDNPDGDAILINSGARIVVEKNTIRGGFNGVTMFGSLQCTIKNNKIAASGPSGHNLNIHDSSFNVFEKNAVIGERADTGLHLVESNSNKVIANDFSSNAYGIRLFDSDRNEFTKNKCNNSLIHGMEVTAIFVSARSSENVIGAGNTFNNNGHVGLILRFDALSNTVLKNTARGNGICDIDNNGTGNLFIKNKAGCVTGVNQS
jgi:parallel beta-helix repeat protein